MGVIKWKDTSVHLQDAIQRKTREIKDDCYKTITSGFSSTVLGTDAKPIQFQLAIKDQVKFDSQVNKINTLHRELASGTITQEEFDTNFPIDWSSMSHGVVQLTEEEFTQACKDKDSFFGELQSICWDLCAQAQGCTAQEQVDAISFKSAATDVPGVII